jgi:hypothetical protein
MSFPNPPESVLQNPLEETLQRISEAWQHKEDAARGWRTDCTKPLQVKSGEIITDELLAEVSYKKSFGFGSGRVMVRIRQFDVLRWQIDLAKGITLLEEGKLFGAEGSWKLNNHESPVPGNGFIDLFLES